MIEPPQDETMTVESFDDKVARLFGARVVHKALAQQEAFARIPRYVTEYLIAKYVRPETAEEDLRRIKEQLRERLPDLDRRELIKDQLVREGHFVLIDAVEVRVDLKTGERGARIPSLDERNARIQEAIVEANPGLLVGGMWGTIKLWYRPEVDRERPVEIVGFTPFQADVSSIDDVVAARAEFTREEWIRLMLASCGLEADAFESDRVRLLLLSRLIPLVESNVNLIELGPRQTGKTFLLRNTSPKSFLLSGGKATPANLFVNLSTRSVGILGSYDVVVFDEIASTSFGDASATVSMLKDYMESGQFSRGAKTYSSDASIVMTGNLDVEGDSPHRKYRHLFEMLPSELIDTAFLDRMHGYLPGWEIPKIRRSFLATGPAFVTDFFGEYLLQLRRREFRGEVHQLGFNQHLTQRDLVAVERLTAGFLKLLYPDGNFTESELSSLASVAVEMRQRVHDQLSVLAPGEFREKRIAFEGMTPSLAVDMSGGAEDTERYDRMNHQPLVGEVTGLALIRRGGQIVGGDLVVVEASVVPGKPSVELTGSRGTDLRESVRTAYNLISTRADLLGVPAGRLQESRLLVHVLHIAEEREGPGVGVAFLVAMVSALTGRPVRPALALTGEVSLLGKVTPVEGLPEKVRTAASHGRRVVIAPEDGLAELDSVPASVLERLEIIGVTMVEEAIEAALLSPDEVPADAPELDTAGQATEGAAPAGPPSTEPQEDL